MVDLVHQARLDSWYRRWIFSIFDRTVILKRARHVFKNAPPPSLRERLAGIWESTQRTAHYGVQAIELAYWKYFTSYIDEEIFLQEVSESLIVFKAIGESKSAYDYLPAYDQRWKELTTLLNQSGKLPLIYNNPSCSPFGLFKVESMRSQMIAAIALKLYQLKHGEWPETLDVLVPEFLTAVPLDPADGQPLRMRGRRTMSFHSTPWVKTWWMTAAIPHMTKVTSIPIFYVARIGSGRCRCRRW